MEGVYTHTVKYEKDPACPMCSASVPFEVASTDTLEKVCKKPPMGISVPHMLDHRNPAPALLQCST